MELTRGEAVQDFSSDIGPRRDLVLMVELRRLGLLALKSHISLDNFKNCSRSEARYIWIIF